MNPDIYSETEQNEPWEWIPCEDGVCITGYSSVDEHLVIPEMIDGRPVRKIAAEAFAYGSFDALTLPDTLQYIDERAFAFCVALEQVTLPDKLLELDGSAFLCTEIHSLKLPRSLQTINAPESLDMHIYADKDHPLFLTDENGLYRKRDNGGLELLSIYTEQEQTYEILPKTTAIAAGAFCNIHAPISLSFPKSLEEIDCRAWNPLFTKNGAAYLKEIRIHPDNQTFFANENGIWKKDAAGITLVRWTGSDRADFDETVTALGTYSMSDRSFVRITLPASCMVEHGAFKGSVVQTLCLKDTGFNGSSVQSLCLTDTVLAEISLPAGAVENNNILLKIFLSGTADLSAYDDMLASGYLTSERIRMSLMRLSGKDISEDRKKRLLARMLSEGALTAELLAKEGDTASFEKWLELPEHNSDTLLPAMETLLSCRNKQQAAASEMLAALQRKKSMLDETDEFEL